MIVAAPPAPPVARAPGRRVVVTVLAIQLASCLGYFSVMAHVVAHLRNDLGLMAGTIGLVLGVRLGVQYVLLLPVGTVTDLIGARLTGVIACVVRAVGFGLLGVAESLGALLGVAVVLGIGGALYNPAVQSLLAGVDPVSRSRGFGGFVATQHAATITGPPLGLLLISLGPGFVLLTGTSAGLWTIAAVLFLLVPRREKRPPARFRDLVTGVRAVFRDRTFVLFALMTAPTTLLANHIMTAVPQLGFGAGLATLCFCLLAAVAAAAQPFVAMKRRGERPWVLRLGLLCAAATFFVLAPLDGTETGPLMLAAVLNGVSNGLVQPSIFQRAVRHAPSERFGSYYGVMASFAGLFACVGDLVIGRLFDFGSAGAATALVGVGVIALVSAFGTRGP
ncbi:MFS transporter [Spirillospora sp. CA-294931]|uniref:MFS transporter n=1 Tax=Spirillospora sp. CA-294931 TaxID=3240042 RepID=UPI003D91FF2B